MEKVLQFYKLKTLCVKTFAVYSALFEICNETPSTGLKITRQPLAISKQNWNFQILRMYLTIFWLLEVLSEL